MAGAILKGRQSQKNVPRGTIKLHRDALWGSSVKEKYQKRKWPEGDNREDSD